MIQEGLYIMRRRGLKALVTNIYGKLRCNGLTSIRNPPEDSSVLDAKATGDLMEGVSSSISIDEFM